MHNHLLTHASCALTRALNALPSGEEHAAAREEVRKSRAELDEARPIMRGFERTVIALRVLSLALGDQPPTSAAPAAAEAIKALTELDAGLDWTPQDEREADSEGWAVVELPFSRTHVFEIQCSQDACDRNECPFDGDDHAEGYVYSRALQGSRLHAKAMSLTLASGRTAPVS